MEEPTTSAKREEGSTTTYKVQQLSAGGEHEGEVVGKVGKKSWSQSREDLEHKAQPREALEHAS